MVTVLSEEERKKLLSQMLLRAKQERNLSYRQMSAQIGVSDVAVINWANGTALPGARAAPMVAAFLDFTPTPFERFMQGALPSMTELREDRLRNLIARLPAEKQDEFLDQIEDLVQGWLRRYRSADHGGTSESE